MSRIRGKGKPATETAMGDAIPPWQARLLANIQADIERRRKLWPLMAQLWSVPYGKRGKAKFRKGYFERIARQVLALDYSIDELGDIYRYELRPVLWKMQVPRDIPYRRLWLRPWRCISLMRRRRMPVEELEQRILKNVRKRFLYHRSRIPKFVAHYNASDSHWFYMSLYIWKEIQHQNNDYSDSLHSIYARLSDIQGSLKSAMDAQISIRSKVILFFAYIAEPSNYYHRHSFYIEYTYNTFVKHGLGSVAFKKIWQEDIKGKMEHFAMSLSPGPRPLSGMALLDAAEAHIANHKAGQVPASDTRLKRAELWITFRLIYNLLKAREYCLGDLNGNKFIAERVGFKDTLARRQKAWEILGNIYVYESPESAAKELFELGYSRKQIIHMKRWEVEGLVFPEATCLRDDDWYMPSYSGYEPHILRWIHRKWIPIIYLCFFRLGWFFRRSEWRALLNHFDKLNKAAKTDKK